MRAEPLIYLDNNATTRPDPEVVEAMLPYLRERWGNPSSPHAFGARLGEDVEAARAKAAALLGARPEEIVFTSGGTESIVTAIRGAAALGRAGGRRRVVTSAVEHAATRGALAALEREGAAEVVLSGVDADGALDLRGLERALAGSAGGAPALLTLLLANNETGVLFPVAEAAARAAGALVHVDAVQAAGKVPLDARALGADLLSISGHKFHGPKGIGVLVVRRGIPLPPLVPGHQEHGRRGGTEDVAAIVGLGVACDLARAHLASGGEARVAALRDRMEERILGTLPGARRSGGASPRLAGTSSLRIPGVDAGLLLSELSRRGIAASSGAACASGSLEPSHVLLAMGISPEEARGALRLSLSRETTEAEVDRAAETVIEVAARLIRLDAAPAASRMAPSS